MAPTKIVFGSPEELLAELLRGGTVTNGSLWVRLDESMQCIKWTRSTDPVPCEWRLLDYHHHMPMQYDFTSTAEVFEYLYAGGTVVTPMVLPSGGLMVGK